MPIKMKVMPVQTVGLYRTTCSQGHSIVMLADFQQFELLFESAMEAFADGYFREAVSSFAASLERYYEFAIKTLLLAYKVDKESISDMWKNVSNQSERQLGMFVGLYTSINNRPPEVLSNNQTAFRNSVIHKGYFPSPEDALDFGNAVYKLLNLGLRELRADYHDAMQSARGFAREAAIAELKDGEVLSTFGMKTTISLMVLDEPPPISEAIIKVAERLNRQRNG